MLSNTCPIYLEGMKKIHLSVEEISAEMDVQGFAEDHKELMRDAVLPQFVPHAYMVRGQRGEEWGEELGDIERL